MLSFLCCSYLSLIFPTTPSPHVVFFSLLSPTCAFLFLSFSRRVSLYCQSYLSFLFILSSATPSNAFIPLTLFLSRLLPTFMSSSSRLYLIFRKIHLPWPYFVSPLHHLPFSTHPYHLLFIPFFPTSYLLFYLLPTQQQEYLLEWMSPSSNYSYFLSLKSPNALSCLDAALILLSLLCIFFIFFKTKQ